MAEALIPTIDQLLSMPATPPAPPEGRVSAKDFNVVNPTPAKLEKLDKALEYLQASEKGRDVVGRMASDKTLKIKISDRSEWDNFDPDDSLRDRVRNNPHRNSFDFKDSAITWMGDACTNTVGKKGYYEGFQSAALMLAQLGEQAAALKSDKTGKPDLSNVVHDELPDYARRSNALAMELGEPVENSHTGYYRRYDFDDVNEVSDPTEHWFRKPVTGALGEFMAPVDPFEYNVPYFERSGGMYRTFSKAPPSNPDDDAAKTPVSINDFVIYGSKVGMGGRQQHAADRLKLEQALNYLQTSPAGIDVLRRLVHSNSGAPIPLQLTTGSEGSPGAVSDFDGKMLKWNPNFAASMEETDKGVSDPGRNGGTQSAALQLIKAAAQASDPNWELNAAIRNLPNGMTGAEVYAENKANIVAAQLGEPQVDLYEQRINATPAEDPTARIFVEYSGTHASPVRTISVTGAKSGPHTMETTQFDLDSGKKLSSVKDMDDGRGGHTLLVTSRARGHEIALTYDMRGAQPQVIEVNKLYGDQAEKTAEQRNFVLQAVQNLHPTPETQLSGRAGLEQLLIPTREARENAEPQLRQARQPMQQNEQEKLSPSPATL